MMHDDTNALSEPSDRTDAPHCANCHTAMRHSCSEALDTGGERRTYECVKCVSTQTVEMAAG